MWIFQDGIANCLQLSAGAGSALGALSTGDGPGVRAECFEGDAIEAIAYTSGKAAVRARTGLSASAVIATAESGYGVDGKSDTNHGVVGRAAAAGKAAVRGIGSGSAAGLSGFASAGLGVEGNSVNGVGGAFEGGAASVRLVPQDEAGAPTGGFHQRGELLVDVDGVLYFCKTEGTPGKWKKVKLGKL